MAPIAVLPLFMPLQGKSVLVAGDSAAAAWKAELLAAAGARVTVCASTPEPDLQRVFAEMKSVRHVAADWTPDDLRGCALAIADCATDAEAARFASAAQAAGVPCNVIDKTAYCTVQFGAIVNRSPIVIGISTNGAAPVLGQAVRQRIETLLPHRLADWAALAQRLRSEIAERIGIPALRRRFWTRFSAAAFSGAAAPEPDKDDDLVTRLMTSLPDAAGSVTHVMTGPGAPDLLTLRAMRALQTADVVLHRADMSPSILDLARREARRLTIDAGEDMAETLLTLARAGHAVVRLAPGDLPDATLRQEIDAIAQAGVLTQLVAGLPLNVEKKATSRDLPKQAMTR